MSYLHHKIIWITGASSGIGEALTYQLAKIEGVKLILSARRKEELERVKKCCPPEAQTNIQILPFDLAQHEILHSIVEEAVERFGHIDILVNNGGISQRSLAKETHVTVDRYLMEVDYFGTMTLSKYMLPHFLKRKCGHFVTVSSVMGMIGTPYRSGYAAAKHALHGFFDSLRAELWIENKNIFVTLICPGWVHTNITLNAMTGDGNKLHKMDKTTAAGLSPKTCAEKIVNAIQKKKEEVYIGGAKEVFAVYLKRFFPTLFSKAVRKMSVR